MILNKKSPKGIKPGRPTRPARVKQTSASLHTQENEKKIGILNISSLAVSHTNGETHLRAIDKPQPGLGGFHHFHGHEQNCGYVRKLNKTTGDV